jgi:hypothetical protein
LRSLPEIQPFLMEEDCGGGQGLSWAVEPRRENNVRYIMKICVIKYRSSLLHPIIDREFAVFFCLKLSNILAWHN